MKLRMQAHVRKGAGKGLARQLRRQGQIPAVLYGQGTSLLLAVEPAAVRKVLLTQAGSTSLIVLTISEGEETTERVAVLQDYQTDPVTGAILHVDFFEVSMEKPVRVHVPIRVIGETPIGVKQGHGVLHLGIRELSVECLPGAIPESIEIDVSPLGVGDARYVRDLQPGEGIKLLDDPDTMVVTVSAPLSEAKLAARLSGEALGAGPAESTSTSPSGE
ncbi:MAG: 50S ribosomal protein L25 [Nitrospirae bacterium]|nr:MAG: 50S ribosomal protein L25 [Nitrospirota bacterium]